MGATPEQNSRLKANFLEVYRDYLEEVAKNNNACIREVGFYANQGKHGVSGG